MAKLLSGIVYAELMLMMGLGRGRGFIRFPIQQTESVGKAVGIISSAILADSEFVLRPPYCKPHANAGQIVSPDVRTAMA